HSLFHRRFILRFDAIDFQEAVEQGGREGGCGLSDHVAARGWGQKSKDEPNTDVSRHQRGSNIIEQVPYDPSKRNMISLDGREFTDPKVSRKITSILKTMFNASWTTWKEVDKSAHDELWAHFKENSMKKRYPDIMLKAIGESVKLAWTAGVQLIGANCSVLKPYNPEWIQQIH
nr:hypothetical protein [Tanacetum cinerariifolium]